MSMMPFYGRCPTCGHQHPEHPAIRERIGGLHSDGSAQTTEEQARANLKALEPPRTIRAWFPGQMEKK